MTLRESLGGDVQRVHEQVDALLDREDGFLVLFDGGRMVSYTQGFDASPDQLELLSVELERAVRTVVGGQPTPRRKDRRIVRKARKETIAPIIVGVDAHVGDLNSARMRLAVERGIDDVLADSFPASDPPSWTLGVARPEPGVGSVGHPTQVHRDYPEATRSGRR